MVGWTRKGTVKSRGARTPFAAREAPSTVTPAAEGDGRKEIIRLEGVSKVYRMGDVEVQALKGVDLTVYQGEFIVILGPSGSGKTTLLNLLGGMDTITSGRMVVNDQVTLLLKVMP